MIFVISSPSMSTTGLATLILWPKALACAGLAKNLLVLSALESIDVLAKILNYTVWQIIAF